MPLFIPCKQLILSTSPLDNENGLVGRWLVDGTGNDFSGNGFVASITGALLQADGIVGNGVSSGTTNGIYASTQVSGLLDVSKYTFCGWLKTGSSNTSYLFAHSLTGVSSNIEIRTSNAIQSISVTHNRATSIYTVTTASSIFKTGVFFHLAVAFDGTNCYFYVNGALVSTLSQNALTSQPTYSAYLCANPAFTGGLNGTLNDARLYNRALSGAEINSIYSQSLAYPWVGEGDLPAINSGSLPTITGTLSVTEADDTLSAVGSVIVSGSISVTEADDTLSATGSVLVAGTLSVTEADDTLSATGFVGNVITGTLSVTEASDTLVATGSINTTAYGTLSVTETSDTLAASALVYATPIPPVPPKTATSWIPGLEWQFWDRLNDLRRPNT